MVQGNKDCAQLKTKKSGIVEHNNTQIYCVCPQKSVRLSCILRSNCHILAQWRKNVCLINCIVYYIFIVLECFSNFLPKICFTSCTKYLLSVLFSDFPSRKQYRQNYKGIIEIIWAVWKTVFTHYRLQKPHE